MALGSNTIDYFSQNVNSDEPLIIICANGTFTKRFLFEVNSEIKGIPGL
jgi:hypothetical protein